MKEVMLSIQPKWCELIVNGKKTIEIRKTKPKLDVPFKCYIYCTKDNLYLNIHNGICYIESKDILGGKGTGYYQRLNGNVIGEFICDNINPIFPYEYTCEDIVSTNSCLTNEQIIQYSGLKRIYGWHISDLKIYNKPKDLGEFRKPCITPKHPYCPSCRVGYESISGSEEEAYRAFGECNTEWCCLNYVTKPPQSWCYVENIL